MTRQILCDKIQNEKYNNKINIVKIDFEVFEIFTKNLLFALLKVMRF